MTKHDMEEQHLKEKGLAYACTDLGNSKRFIDQHTDLRYLWEERRWVKRDGTRWRPCSKPYKQAAATVKRIYNEARDCKITQGQRELSTWAHKSQALARIEPMLSLAADALSVSITDFDTDQEVINCKNGIVDLRTGVLTEHDPEQLVMKRASAAFDPSATCPLWRKFLYDVFRGDLELIDYVQRALGYSITGRTNEHCLFIAYGLGANGKTTLFETVLDILGDYGRVTDFALFLNTDKSDARKQEAIGRLRGVRIVIASETESTKSWKEAIVKKLTGGDTLTGTKLYGSSYEFQPTHTLWFQANHLPGVKDASHGFWRRVRVIPFKAKFEGDSIDTEMRETLLGEREGIFNWLVQGARAYLADGMGEVPKSIEETTADYRSSNDVLGRFIDERLEREFGQTVGVQETYDKYQLWCFKEKETSIPMNYFAKGMEERGITKKKTNTGKVFVNCKLASDVTEPQRAANDDWKQISWERRNDQQKRTTLKPKSIDDIFEEIGEYQRTTQTNGRSP